MLATQLTPPIIKTLIRKTFFPTKVYNDFESTQRAISHFQNYEYPSLIDIIFHKTKNFIEEIKQNPPKPLETHHLFLLSLIGLIAKKENLTVLDFGGAFGTHYFIVKKFFPHLTLNWIVVELPSVVEKGKALENNELQFIDIKNDFDTPVAENIDLVLTSATLQHVPDPQKVLHFLCKHNAPYLALLRLGVNLSNKNIWLIHKAQFKDCGPGQFPENYENGVAAFPFCMMSEQKLNEALSTYELILSNLDQSGTLLATGHQIQGSNRLYACR